MRADILYNNVIDGEEFDRAQAAADAAAFQDASDIDPSTFYVTQLYDRYSAEDHDVWATLVRRRMELTYSTGNGSRRSSTSTRASRS